jgi:hypothetical protein
VTHLIVCTHSRHDLARGAVASVRRHATDDLRVTVLDSSGLLHPWDAVEVRHIDCPRYHHAAFAKQLSRSDELTVCIDDDVRLVSDACLEARYTAGWHKPPNGHMVTAWRQNGPYTRLSQWRTPSRCDFLPALLCERAAQTNAEQIDTIWLHIDKGSTPSTPERDALIRLIDHGPGLGDMVAAGLSSVGITKERVSRALGRPCKCPKRQQKLNELGRKFGIG